MTTKVLQMNADQFAEIKDCSSDEEESSDESSDDENEEYNDIGGAVEHDGSSDSE